MLGIMNHPYRLTVFPGRDFRVPVLFHFGAGVLANEVPCGGIEHSFHRFDPPFNRIIFDYDPRLPISYRFQEMRKRAGNRRDCHSGVFQPTEVRLPPCEIQVHQGGQPHVEPVTGNPLGISVDRPEIVGPVKTVNPPAQTAFLFHVVTWVIGLQILATFLML